MSWWMWPSKGCTSGCCESLSLSWWAVMCLVKWWRSRKLSLHTGHFNLSSLFRRPGSQATSLLWWDLIWYTKSLVIRKLMLHLAHIFCAVRVNVDARVGGINVERMAAAAGFLGIPGNSACWMKGFGPFPKGNPWYCIKCSGEGVGLPCRYIKCCFILCWFCRAWRFWADCWNWYWYMFVLGGVVEIGGLMEGQLNWSGLSGGTGDSNLATFVNALFGFSIGGEDERSVTSSKTLAERMVICGYIE